MGLVDPLITGREALISTILGFRSDAVLNADGDVRATMTGPQLGATLKRAVNALKAEGIDATGEHVDYVRLAASSAYATYRAELTPQLRSLDLATLATRGEQLAFWINLYNALVLDATIAFGVRQSVTEGRAGLVSFFRRAAYNVGGYRFSTNDIEHGILRANRAHWAIPGPQFGPSDPRLSWRVAPLDNRIHFALNCASRSCPPIGVYDASQIDRQLDLAAANFIANTVAVEPDQNTVRLSTLFKWYAGDFGGRAGVIALLLQHMPDTEARKWLSTQRSGVRFVYRPYDWSLNSPERNTQTAQQ